MCVYSVSSQAEDYRFYVTDRQGNPLKDAALILPGTVAEPSSKLAIMDQVDVSFAPKLLVVEKGQRVSFPNSDNIRHHVYSFSPVKSFEIKLYKGTPEAPLLFDEAGIVVLGCNIHDSMVGYIVVSDSPYAGSTNEEGLLSLSTDKPVERLRVWHPLLATTSISPLSLPIPRIDEEGRRNIVLNVELPEEKPESANTFKKRYKRK